ncbi:MAG: hypothetical protein AB1644_01625 [Candidatus Zixiibacteriota bacterium]
MKSALRLIAPVLPALLLYGMLAAWLNFTQDDAYITYRYAANYLNGHGLVYNIGERVEGFTNFGWLVYLLVWGALHIDLITISKITGAFLGAGAIVVTYLTARRIFPDDQRWFSLLPPYLLAANLSLAYWSPAGLETAAFVFLAVLCLHWYVTHNWLLMAGLAISAWVRPEGALLAGLFVIIESLTERRFPRFTLLCAIGASIVSVPLALFKLLYYGSIFPNPFYAKTGWSLDQLVSGLEYAAEFAQHYGFVGLGLILPLVFIKQLSKEIQAVWWLAVLYTLYIVVIGGDVLKVHRFFLPVAGAFAILAAWSISTVIRRRTPKATLVAGVIAGLIMTGLTVYLPYDTVIRFNRNERGFTHKMAALANFMRSSDDRPFSAALPTIGIFGYELLGHQIIDMVGLTDSTIARHPEAPIPDLKATWKERNHNTPYLLSRKPDYVVFSTGVKPSAPAEQALMLYSEFVMGYRQTGWFYQDVTYSPRGMMVGAFKRMKDLPHSAVPAYSLEWVQQFKAGEEAVSSQDFRRAVSCFERALAAPSSPNYPELLNSLGFSYMRLKQEEPALTAMNRALAVDSATYMTHRDLYLYYSVTGNHERGQYHREWLRRLVPWYLSRADYLISQALETQHRAGQSVQPIR